MEEGGKRGVGNKVKRINDSKVTQDTDLDNILTRSRTSELPPLK